jgi:NADH:ubiquinone oxidoreductase subunit 3 (subunit A)
MLVNCSLLLPYIFFLSKLFIFLFCLNNLDVSKKFYAPLCISAHPFLCSYFTLYTLLFNVIAALLFFSIPFCTHICEAMITLCALYLSSYHAAAALLAVFASLPFNLPMITLCAIVIGYYLGSLLVSYVFSLNLCGFVSLVSSNFECGFVSSLSTHIRFKLNYWLIIINFIIFELEVIISFLYIFSIVSYLSYFLFLFLLLLLFFDLYY